MFTEPTQKLFFLIELIDRVTAPSKAMVGQMAQVQKQFGESTKDIAQGGAGLLSAGYGMLKVTESARNLKKAIGEVASLDVPVVELDKLASRSKDFVGEYGGNLAEIVKSGYDIQSAIPGLAKGALSEFTYQGNLLAKAGKSNAETITKYQGTMYNIFERDAKRIGEAKWIEQLTGKTAHAIKIFKTTGNEMSAAFTNLGSTGQVGGISMDEQLAILGTLQGTMGGANAGTAYKAFLNKVGTAQTALGMKFTDANGKMLPMVEILEKIRKQVGPGQLKIADQTRLMQAFGDEGGKAVLNLLDKTEQLKSNISGIGKITDSGNAAQMAKAMTDELDRFSGVWDVFKTSFFTSVLPIVNTGLTTVSFFLMNLVKLTDALPPLRWAVAAVTVAFFGLFAAFGVIKLWIGMINMLKVLHAAFAVLSARIHAATIAQQIHAVTTKACALASLAYNAALNAGVTAMIASGLVLAQLNLGQRIAAVSSWLMSSGFLGAAAAAWTFTVALLACPITWIAVGIAALIAAVAALIYYWKDLCALTVKYADYLLMMIGPIGWVIAAFRNWDKITEIFQNIWAVFKRVCPNLANLIEKLFAIFWAGIRESYNFWVSVFQKIYHFTAGILKAIGNFFVGLWDGVMDGIHAFYDAFSDILLSIYQWFDSIFGGFFSGVGGIIREVIGAITNADQWLGSMLSKLSKIPGFGFLDPNVTAENPPASGIRIPEGREIRDAEKITRMANPPAIIENTVVNRSTDYSGDTVNQKSSLFSSVIAARTERDVPAGGVRSNTKNNYFGSVTITAPNGMGPGELEEWALLQG